MTTIFCWICTVNAILVFGNVWSSATVRYALPVGVILKQSGSVEYIIMYTCVKREGESTELTGRKELKNWCLLTQCHILIKQTQVRPLRGDSGRNLIRSWHQVFDYTFHPIHCSCSVDVCVCVCVCVFEPGFYTWADDAAVSQILIFHRRWFVPDFNLGSDWKKKPARS